VILPVLSFYLLDYYLFNFLCVHLPETSVAFEEIFSRSKAVLFPTQKKTHRSPLIIYT